MAAHLKSNVNYKSTTEAMRDVCVQACIVYPRTTTLQDKPVTTLYLDTHNPDYIRLRQAIDACEPLTQLHGMEDIRYILESCSRLHRTMLFFKMDTLVIHKKGIHLVHIIMRQHDGSVKGINEHSRFACIDIHTLRMRVAHCIQEDASSSVIGSWLTQGVICIFSTCILHCAAKYFTITS